MNIRVHHATVYRRDIQICRLITVGLIKANSERIIESSDIFQIGAFIDIIGKSEGLHFY